MSATCPDLLSVGTRVCDIPNAPLVSMIDRKWGATTLGESGTIVNPFFASKRSARNPSPCPNSQH